MGKYLGWHCFIQVLDGLSSYYHEHIWTKQVTYFQALFSQREKNLQQPKAEHALLQLTWKMELEHKRSRLRSFVSIVLKICLSFLHLFTFVILAGPHFAISHFLIIMNIFCFMSVPGHSKLPQNQQSHSQGSFLGENPGNEVAKLAVIVAE